MEGGIGLGRRAFIFPGQGAQYTGMGKDFYEGFQTAREVFDIAREASGLDVAQLVFSGDERLNITEYTQIAMLTVEVAVLKVLEEKGLAADCCAGLSLGEYGALAAARVMELPDLFHLIRRRGIYMQEAYPTGGAMTAVLGLEADVVREICAAQEGIVAVANDNCPGQVVISGEEKAVEAAAAALTVSGPFHSVLLAGAGEKLAGELESVEVKDPVIPYLCNVEAAPVTEKSRVRELLAKQVSGTVRWRETMERMLSEGVDSFVEIGPGKTLSGFLKKIDKTVKVWNVETVEDMNRLFSELTQ